MTGREFNGVVFFEDCPDRFSRGAAISTEINGFFSSSQIASLDDVLKAMAIQCRELGGKVIVDFKYGQRALGFFASILSRDNVVWYGRGFIGLSRSG